MNQLLTVLDPRPSESILEVGVANREYSSLDNFVIKHYYRERPLTALGIGDLSEFKKHYPDVRAISYDGAAFPFQDKSFDVAHANAVIEHVGPIDAQRRFLKEMVRVSRRGMLTTPNRRFPVETHTRILFLHWMKKEWFDRCLRSAGKGWAAGDYMHLLGKKELDDLARESGATSYRIIPNRFMGCAMTFSLVWFEK